VASPREGNALATQLNESDALTSRLEGLYTGVIYDVMREMGEPWTVLPQDLAPLAEGQKLTGRVFTVEGRRDDDLDNHETMLAWTDFLSRAPAGHVVVCQPNDATIAHMGELSAETLQLRGIRGYVVDGGCRDVEFIRHIRFPTWCRYTTPADIRGRWRAERFEESIEIGGVTINNGDYLVADADGVIIIPQQRAKEVVAAAEEAVNQEDLVRLAIRNGTSPQEAYLEHGKF
jgi:4-hydroxy-4-methyl-2-oxoglutarate aldolase